MDKNKPVRIDKIIGGITLIVIAAFALIIYMDMKKQPVTQGSSQTQGQTQEEVTVEPTTQEVVIERTEEKVKGTYTVCLDAGNGGSDQGYKSGNVFSKNVNLELVKSVKKYLEESGVKVALTRSEDVSLTKEQRVEACNKANGSLMVSLSMTSASSNTKSGATAYIHNKVPQADKALADAVIGKMKTLLKDENASVKIGTDDGEEGNFYINNHCLCPSVVVHFGYISNSEDLNQFTTDKEQAAAAIADGIVAYLNSLNN